MLQDILEAIRIREEKVSFLGRTFIVRELSASANLGIAGAPADEQAETSAWWRMFVRCVLDEDGKQVFRDEDIAELQAGSRVKLAPLLAAVNRVNGLDLDDNAKNSNAVQA